jgi:ISXO2-like transposase domain
MTGDDTAPDRMAGCKARATPANRIEKGTLVNADQSGAWNNLHARYQMKRINHHEAYSLNGACTNWTELFFLRMRPAEVGHHHHVAGPCLIRFAQEAAWRADNRRLSNGEQVHRIAGLAMASKRSVDFTGYWQRHINTG